MAQFPVEQEGGGKELKGFGYGPRGYEAPGDNPEGRQAYGEMGSTGRRMLGVAAPAPLAHRLGAAFIDGIVVGVVMYCLVGISFVSLIGGVSRQPLTPAEELAQFYQLFQRMMVINVAVYAIQAAYFVWFHTKSGQTLGKKAARIRVVTIDGSPLTWGKALLRYIGMLIGSSVFWLGNLWALWDSDRQTWHDKIAGTIVVADSDADLPPRLSPQAAWEQRRRWLIFVAIVGLGLALIGYSYFTNFRQLFSLPLTPVGG
jgi:uncharacterized RDD family membrane protein YckC